MYRHIDLSPEVRDQATPPPSAVAVALFESEASLPEAYAALDQQAGGAIARVLGRSEFKAAKASVSIVYPERGPERVFLVGLGPREKFDAEALRQGIGRLARAAFAAKVTRLDLPVLAALQDHLSPEQIGHAVGDGLALAGFQFNRFKGAVNKPGEEPAALDLLVDAEEPLRPGIAAALKIGRGVTTARRLAATPPNVANPSYIAEQCQQLAGEVGLRYHAIDADEAQRLGMGGLTAVGRAGSAPPMLLILEWPGEDRGAQPILLVGKAITFDTGGYSVKPSGSMTGMKYDKCGGMSVIGAMEAVARLNLPQRVVGIVPCAENMIDASAYRVDDILTFYNGVTTEVTNTDAEGRLVLADALAYGTSQYDPAAVIDLATLTGGVVVALGSFCAGVFVNDDRLRQRLDDAAGFTGERLWELPLWDDHREMMKGTHADLVNSGERKAHPIQGAAFLSFFVGKDAPKKLPTLPWAHLDIAGVSNADKETPLFDKGPTGYGVRLLARLISQW